MFAADAFGENSISHAAAEHHHAIGPAEAKAIDAFEDPCERCVRFKHATRHRQVRV
jgi:hypothetical protein